MPGSIKKDLYMAKSVHDLNKLASEIPKVTNARMFATTAEKVHRGAEEAYNLGDEERSYVLYMKYFNVVSAIKKSADYRKQQKFIDDLLGKKNCLNAIERAEELSSSLKTRYEEAEAIEVSKKLDKLDTKENSVESDSLVILSDASAPKENQETAIEQSENTVDFALGTKQGGIDVQTLYRLIKDPEVKLLLIDIRSVDDFETSHIISENAVSVPQSVIPPGCVVSQIEKHLPASSVKLWKMRGSVDYVVLFDWSCSAALLSIQSPLTYLKDALFKWDQETVLRHEPLILNGGYEEWLMCYPSLTTNPNIKCPLLPINGSAPVLSSLDSIDYDVELEFLKPPKPPPSASPPDPAGEMSSSAIDSPPQTPAMPSFDRSTKPRTVLNNSTNAAMRNDSKPDFNGARIVNMIGPSLSKRTENLPPPKTNIPDKNTNQIKDISNVATSTGSATSSTISAVPMATSQTVCVPRTAVPEIDRTKKPPARAPIMPQISGSSSDDEVAGPSSDRRKSGKVGGTEEAELKQLMHIRRMKEQEVKSLAEIMRMKKKMQEEMKKEEEKEANEEMIEERNSSGNQKRDIGSIDVVNNGLSVENEMGEAKKKDESPEDFCSSEQRPSADRMTENDKTMALSSKYNNLKKENEKKAVEQEQSNKEDSDKECKRMEEERATELEKAQAEEIKKREREKEKRLQLEMEVERQRKLEEEMERKKLEAAKREQMEREREEKERIAKEAEAKRKAREGEERQVAANNRMGKDVSVASTAEPSCINSEASLPSGWEKCWDMGSRKYYYIDHNTKKTYWDPPGSTQQKQANGRATVYKERLKDEGSAPLGGEGGLKRSHSSPNIAKMIQDEEDAARRIQPIQPLVDRSIKPKPTSQMLVVRTEVSEAKVRNLQPTWGSMGCGLTGLRNLGNTCYMNSTLQCLSNAAPLTVYFLTDVYTQDIVRDESRRYRGEVASEYAVLIKAIWRGQYKALAPRDFRGVVCKMNPMFASTQHQDSHELLEILMNGLNEDLNKVRIKPQLPEQNNDNIEDEVAADQVWKQSRMIEDSIIVDLFRGQYKSTLTCMRCQKKSVMFEPFMCLNLPIPSPTRCSLSDCLLHFSKEEKMGGDSRWHCPQCKSYQDAIKRIVVWRLPPVLIVHLERFYYQGIWRDKITANVDFPIDNLDMNRYISGPATRPAYNLFAVSNHFGTLDGGHYTAYCKSPVAGKWYKFDDQDVSEMSKSDIKSSAAYMLFYSSMKMDQLKL